MSYVSAIAVDFGSTNSGCCRVCEHDSNGELIYANPEFPIQQHRSIGRYNQSFIDEVARQISEELMALSGCVLSPKWGIVMEEKLYCYGCGHVPVLST